MDIGSTSFNRSVPSADVGRHRGAIASDGHRQIVTIINYVILCGVISFFGVISNVINMVIFCKQGLTTTINIRFFAMAVSDLCSLLLQQLFNVFVNPLVQDLGWPMRYSDVQHLTSGIPREAFARVTCLITVYVTAERCLCIAFPLHVKQMITPRRTTVTMCLIYALTAMSFVPLYTTSRISWGQDGNRSLLMIVIQGDHEATQAFVYVTHGATCLVSFLLVVALTFTLIRKLGEKSAWRETASGQQDGAMSRKERSTMAMVALIAAILIACYTPAVVLAAVTFLVPEFSVGGRFYNLYYITWSFALLFETVNSSVNIFLYYKMSSKFRKTFHGICASRGSGAGK